MRQVNLPPGCKSLLMQDGKRYVAAREGGKVTVSDEHAKAIDKVPGNGTAGLVSANGGFYAPAGGKPGRVCCGRTWYAFTKICPKCGAATEPERGALPQQTGT